MNLGGDEISRIIYLVLLGLVVIGWFFAQNRQKLNKTLQQIVLWVLLFAGMTLLYGLKDDLRLQLSPRASVEVSENQITLFRSNDRHFYATLLINGQKVEFVIDTGASDIVLSQQDARKVGIKPEELAYYGTANTANGEVATARVKLKSVQFGGFEDSNVTAWVNDGDMFGSLLGMRYLSRFQTLEIIGDKMVLSR